MEQIGRYKIVRELGRGAMGVVYHAIDPTIGRPVAIKTIRLREVDDPAQRDRLLERLFREARSAGVLSHPGIVTIYDMDEVDGLAFIAMEYVDGATLDHLMSEPKPIPQETFFNLMRQTAAALDYAHEKGVVHRDIKPANIMVDPTGVAKITDFGIAKVTTNDNYTVTGTIIGTPNYMSPEQVQGIAIDGRSDQFSLGVVVYEVLTGERPFPGEHLSTVVYKIVAEEPLSAQRINPTLGPEIEGVLSKALAKKPAARYETSAEFIAALEAACAATAGWKNLVRGGSSSLPTVISPLAESKGSTASAGGTLSHVPKRKSSALLPIVGAGVMALGLIGLIAWQANPDWRSHWPFEPAPQKPAEAAKTESPKHVVSTQVAPPPPDPSAAADPSLDKPVSAVADSSGTGKRAAPGRPQDIWVNTNPPGATATLDANSATTCSTPCMLQGMPGVHSVEVAMVGMQTERREIRVGAGSQDLPLVTLRPAIGTLMVTTIPPGASVSVDGKLLGERTPTQINLAPGSYHLVVEKNGKRVAETIEIKNGNTNFLKIPLTP